MKQLGNLAIVCACRKDVLLQVIDGGVTVHAGRGPDKTVFCCRWDDDEKISGIVHELNFGRYAKERVETQCKAS